MGSLIKKRRDGTLEVPDNPTIAYVEGDGTGRDIWKASVRVFDAAVAKAFGGRRKIGWHEVLAGQKAYDRTRNWLPDETVETFRKCLVGIKGPLTTPIGGGIRSLNVALRQILDLYVCLRPVKWYEGVPSPVRHPEQVGPVGGTEVQVRDDERAHADRDYPASACPRLPSTASSSRTSPASSRDPSPPCCWATWARCASAR